MERPYFKNSLKYRYIYLSNNGEKIAVTDGFSFVMHDQGPRCNMGFTGKSESAARNVPGAKAGIIYLSQRRYVPVQSKQSNQLFCIMKYSFYNY